jgi:hypothetical protein
MAMVTVVTNLRHLVKNDSPLKKSGLPGAAIGWRRERDSNPR